MENNNVRNMIRTVILFILFLAFTFVVCKIDVKAIGPEGSSVGLSTVNGLVAKFLPYNEKFYKITKYLGYFAILICVFFAAMGIWEFVSKKSLAKVDPGIIILGIFYVVVVIFYVLFMKVVVNYRPVLEDGALESSYPSSHTMLAVCVFLSAAIQIARGRGSRGFKGFVRFVMVILTIVMVAGRLACGVHWFTDIVGGVLLAAALVSIYTAAVQYIDYERRRKV